MAEFKTIETQEQFDEAIKDRLARERATLEKKFQDYLSPDQLSAKTKELSDQITGLTQQLSEANETIKKHEASISEKDAQIKKHETASVKSRIAHELGLSYESVAFIQGEDEAAIKASAEALKGIIGKGSTAPLAEHGGKPADNRVTALKGMLSDIKGE